MKDLLMIFSMGHNMESCWTNVFIVVLAYITIILQVAVVVQAYVIRQRTVGIRFWSTAWSVYLWAMVVICVRRIITIRINFDVMDRLDGRFSTGFLVDNIFLTGISLMWFVFISKIKTFLDNYYNVKGEGTNMGKSLKGIRTHLRLLEKLVKSLKRTKTDKILNKVKTFLDG